MDSSAIEQFGTTLLGNGLLLGLAFLGTFFLIRRVERQLERHEGFCKQFRDETRETTSDLKDRVAHIEGQLEAKKD